MLIRSYIQDHREHLHFLSTRQFLTLRKNSKSPRQEIISVAKALVDPTKLRIIGLLLEVNELVVSDIASILNLSQSTVSHALADLKGQGFLDSCRCGKLICYSIKKDKKKFLKKFYKQSL